MIVGLFAGRGDIVLAMLLAFVVVVGAWVGWKLKHLKDVLKQKYMKSE